MTPFTLLDERALLIYTHRSNGSVLLGRSRKELPVRLNFYAWREVTGLADGHGESTLLCRVAHLSDPPGSLSFTPPAGMTRLYLWYAPAQGHVTVMGAGGSLALSLLSAAALGLRDLVASGIVAIDVLRLPLATVRDFLPSLEEEYDLDQPVTHPAPEESP